jgi:hypothetical protein
MIGQPGVDSGATFILDLAKGNKHIPHGNLLGAQGQVGGFNELDENLTYIAADSRIDTPREFEQMKFEKIAHNPLHPLDFLGVRVELSKPFNSSLFSKKDEESSVAEETDFIKPPEA